MRSDPLTLAASCAYSSAADAKSPRCTAASARASRFCVWPPLAGRVVGGPVETHDAMAANAATISAFLAAARNALVDLRSIIPNTSALMTDPPAVRGKLYVVGTPIGNLDDLSPRAREVLAAADVIAAEDTRRTRGLLSRIGVEARLIAYHEHNEDKRVDELLERLAAGANVALVSDAGTPLISDPGWRLVNAARAAGFDVVPVPGPSAAIVALSAAGLPTDRFVFEGFLPRREAARAERLRELQARAPHARLL